MSTKKAYFPGNSKIYREKTLLPAQKVSLVIANLGVGDYVCMLPSLINLVLAHGHIHFTVFAKKIFAHCMKMYYKKILKMVTLRLKGWDACRSIRSQSTKL